jgi:hypothetical protein
MKIVVVVSLAIIFASLISVATPAPIKTVILTSTATPIPPTPTLTSLPTPINTPIPSATPIHASPPTFAESISVISNTLVGLSAVAVAIIGFIGLKQWRAELTGKTKFDSARKMAVLTFQYRDEFKRARNPFTFSGESAERQKGANETPDETNLLDEYFARRKRLAPLQETLRQLYEASWEAEILLDKDINMAIIPLENSFKELFASMEAYFQTRISQAKRKGQNINDEWLQPHYKNVYGTADDEISKSIDTAANALVERLKSYIK